MRRVATMPDWRGILRFFDEVIPGFGRTGSAFASQTFGVTPDMIVFAKGISNGAVPLGGVVVKKGIYDALMNGPEWAIEFYHGYTYSGHPLATAAALATLDLYQREGLFERARELAPYFEDAVHSLKGLPHVIDVRNVGLMCGVELDPVPGKPGMRAYERFLRCFENSVLVRAAGDVIALTPPLIVDKKQIDEIVGTLADALKSTP